MAEVHIIRHRPGALCGTCEVVQVDSDRKVTRLVEPSGNVGTQYPHEVGAEWFGTIENLGAGLALGKAHGSDVYKTDVMWTTPSGDRDACERRKDDFNRVYAPMLQAVTGGPLRSNRMARFTHPEGFPDPRILSAVDARVRQAGGAGLRPCGVFNNAYIVTGADSEANRASLKRFNQSFSEWYTGVVPAARTAQFVGGIQQPGLAYGIASGSTFA